MISNASRRVARRTSGDQPTSEGRDIGRSLPHRGPGRRLQSGAVRRENDRLALEAAEARPVPEDIANIVLRLADPGNQASPPPAWRSEEPTSELQPLMRNSYAVFCLKKKNEYT